MDIKLIVSQNPCECRVIVNDELLPVTKAVLTMEGGKVTTLSLDIPIIKPMVIDGTCAVETSPLVYNEEIGRQVYEQLKERYEK